MNDLIRISNALADHGRVRLLAMCFDGERCVCQLVALLGLSNASVSKHLSLLRDAGLLSSRKQGRWVHYRLPAEPSTPAAEAIEWIRRHAARDDVLKTDREQMKQIMTIDPGALCRVLRAGGDVLAMCESANSNEQSTKECC